LISDKLNKINSRPYIEAKYINRYKINTVKYLEWETGRSPDKLARKTFAELYIHPKIVRGATVDGTYDDTGLLCNHSIDVMVKYVSLKSINNRSINNGIKKWTSKNRKELENISLNFDLKYILAVLNSKFAKFYLNGIRRHRIEFYFYPDDFKRLPIKKISLDHQFPFIEKADEMLELNRKVQDELNSFKDWLMHTFNIGKLSQKLEKYYELSFEDFLNEVKKKKINVKSRDNYQTLKEEFEKNIAVINPLLQEIEKTDNEIDQMVYDLYGLTSKEIKIIEGSLN